jgi:hypothetical protein
MTVNVKAFLIFPGNYLILDITLAAIIENHRRIEMLRRLLVIGLLGLSASAANAVGQYGMAGCGIGALVFGDKPGSVQIAAGLLNNLISPQTSAITSGTSNCYEDGGRAAADMYIETNKVSLQEDVARGQGETLSGLLTLWKCDNTAQISSSLQQNYNQIFASPTSSNEIKGTMQNTIKSNKDLATSCQTLI